MNLSLYTGIESHPHDTGSPARAPPPPALHYHPPLRSNLPAAQAARIRVSFAGQLQQEQSPDHNHVWTVRAGGRRPGTGLFEPGHGYSGSNIFSSR